VTVSAQADGAKFDLWAGRQQDLFRKYGDKRKRSMAAIRMAVEELQAELEDA